MCVSLSPLIILVRYDDDISLKFSNRFGQEVAAMYGANRATLYNIGEAKKDTNVRYKDVAGIDKVKVNCSGLDAMTVNTMSWKCHCTPFDRCLLAIGEPRMRPFLALTGGRLADDAIETIHQFSDIQNTACRAEARVAFIAPLRAGGH